MRRIAISALVLALGAASSCGSDERAPSDEGESCNSSVAPATFETLDVDRVTIALDLPEGDGRAALAADLEALLAKLWDVSVVVESGSSAPDPNGGLAIWISSSAAAREAAGGVSEGYALRRNAGDARIVVAAVDPKLLGTAVYALLEELGIRFFHPMQEFVPSFEAVRVPATLSIDRRPAFAVRGLHLHTLHPIEYLAPLTVPGAENLDAAKRLIDWLVKTGQNHLQWYLLEDMDRVAWKPHARAIIDYAHARGCTVGVVVQLWGGSSLQNSVVLVDEETDWQKQMSSGLDALMEHGWDSVEVSLGEFLAADPAALVEWLNFGTQYMADKYPGVTFATVNHIGNEEKLWVDYQGKKTFYYHLPGLADPRLLNSVHTVMWFDLYREGGAYGHPNFHLHRDFILEQAGKRPLHYRPESAYWATADIDVPAFLPEYINARHIDVSGLVKDLAQAGLPPLDGHMMFSSGHEWGYWMTDYLTAKMFWEPDQPLSHFLEHYADAYGPCSSDAAAVLGDFLKLQTQYLFDARLMPYISGEDAHDDAGTLIGVETHPPRVRFEKLYDGSEDERVAFETDVLEPIDAAVSAIVPVEKRASSLCTRSDETVSPWCEELYDGIRIVRLRLAHSAALYRAVLAAARKKSDVADRLDEATEIRTQAEAVIRKRESGYRFPLETLTEAYDNSTSYSFGYLRQAHTLCFWVRQHEQVVGLVEEGVAPPFSKLPSCLK